MWLRRTKKNILLNDITYLYALNCLYPGERANQAKDILELMADILDGKNGVESVVKAAVEATKGNTEDPMIATSHKKHAL
jgi:hypothetical protein